MTQNAEEIILEFTKWLKHKNIKFHRFTGNSWGGEVYSEFDMDVLAKQFLEKRKLL